MPAADCPHCHVILTASEAASSTCPSCRESLNKRPTTIAAGPNTRSGEVPRLGFTLIIIGIGSLFLPLFDLQFRVMMWVDGMQPWGGIAVACLGGGLVLTRYSRNAQTAIKLVLTVAVAAIVVLTVLGLILINIAIFSGN